MNTKYNNWFDSKYYHILYKNRNHQEAREFIKKLLKHLKLKKKSKVLDAGCGKGRHSIEIEKLGHIVTGIDLSKNKEAAKTIIESAEYNFDGSLMCKINTVYDEKGNKIGYFYYKSLGKYYQYFGKQLKNYNRFNIYYTYDENQNLIEEFNYNSDGILESLSKFKYDNKGNRIE